MSENITRPIIGIENRTAQEVFDIMAARFKAPPPPHPISVGAEPKRWLAEWTLPSGSIRWQVFEHEHQARVFQSGQPENPRVTALYDHPAPAELSVGDLDDDLIVRLAREHLDENTFSCATYGKSSPLYPQDSYVVPTYGMKQFVKAVRAAISASEVEG